MKRGTDSSARILMISGSAIAATYWLIPAAHAQVDNSEQDAVAVQEKVVVTARKREESLIDVPITLQAYSGDELAYNRIDNVENLIGRTPNLSLSSNVLSPGNDFLNLAIRGIGAQSAGTPAVGTFVDGVFVPSLSFDIGFLDVERVEVLKGPQGTLFGRNTQGGALNIVLRRPDENVRARAAFTYDDFNTARAQGSISGPLGESVFGAFAADVSTTDGYLENSVVTEAAGGRGLSQTVPANDQRRYSLRGALRYRPSDDFDVNLAIDTSRRSGGDGLPGVPRSSEEYLVRSDFQIDGETENTGGAVTIDYALDSIQLTSISGYRKITSFLPFDFDGSPERGPNFQDIQSEQELFSQEFRVAGGIGNNVDWLAGAYVFSEDQISDRSIQFADIDLLGSGSQLLVDAQVQNLERQGYALFGDVIWQPMNWLELNAGLRYTDESIDSQADLDFVANLPDGTTVLSVVAQPVGSVSDTNVSPTFSARAKVSDDISVFVRYARGFRAGGFPLAPASAISNISFDSETSDNYEIGIKGALFDGRINFDASAFQIDIKDQQVTTVIFFNDDPNLPIASVANAGESQSVGMELNLSAQVTDQFEIYASTGFVDATYEEYIDTVGTDRSGESFPFVPEMTAQIGSVLTVPLGDSWDLDLKAEYRYIDNILSGSGVDVDLQFPVDSYDIIDLSASFRRDDWRLDLFVDNVADEFIETRVFNSFFFAEPRPFSQVLPPRRVGARLTYSFD